MAKNIKAALERFFGGDNPQEAACAHITEVTEVTPSTYEGCEDCLKTGDEWVNLRLCLTCGHVGCCDSSKNKHATRHHNHTHHPVITSYEEGENWLWCYVDQVGSDP